MLLAYLLALIPALIGGVLWALRREVVWWEWLLVTATGFAISGVFHALALHAMTDDVEVWSGRMTSARHIPTWTEAYEVPIYHTVTRTTAKGTVHVREQVGWQPRLRVHPAQWIGTDTLDGAAPLTARQYAAVRTQATRVQHLPGVRTTTEHGSHLSLGNPDDEVLSLPDDPPVPVTAVRHWENRIQACPSTFSFAPVPPGTPVFPYPLPTDRLSETRLVGTAAQRVPALDWARMNSRLGPALHVNVILIGFPSGDQALAEQQRAAWIGGKKNDLVICCGPLHERTSNGTTLLVPAWTWVFGWTDAELAKTAIASALLQHPLDASVVPVIEALVRQHYHPRDWSSFDYLDVDVPWWSYLILIAAMGIVEALVLRGVLCNSAMKS